ncbi:unannotated protein [freshwater metagenome]|uniref:Unannotated protein n=1 Tax=freshwater metagenome TaxID=449393 RepID=A0A6J6MX98_9ZZZZ
MHLRLWRNTLHAILRTNAAIHEMEGGDDDDCEHQHAECPRHNKLCKWQTEHIETNIGFELRITNRECLAIAKHQPVLPFSRCGESQHQGNNCCECDAQFPSVLCSCFTNADHRLIFGGVRQCQWCNFVCNHQIDEKKDECANGEYGSKFDLACENSPVHLAMANAVEPQEIHIERREASCGKGQQQDSANDHRDNDSASRWLSKIRNSKGRPSRAAGGKIRTVTHASGR